MSLDLPTALKAMAPKFAMKAVQTFDKATMVVVGACWGAAILMMAFALYTVSLSASTKRAAEAAAASEPALPKITRKPMEMHDAQVMVDRLQHRFAGINFSLGSDQSVSVTTNDGAKFREWLNALGYIDTVSPQYRWSLREFCAGKCQGNMLMQAVLTGEKISFEANDAKAGQ